MTLDLAAVVIDAAEPEPETAFWYRLLGGSIVRTPTHHFLRIDGFPMFMIQRRQGTFPGLAGGRRAADAPRPDDGRPRGRRQGGVGRRCTSTATHRLGRNADPLTLVAAASGADEAVVELSLALSTVDEALEFAQEVIRKRGG